MERVRALTDLSLCEAQWLKINYTFGTTSGGFFGDAGEEVEEDEVSALHVEVPRKQNKNKK